MSDLAVPKESQLKYLRRRQDEIGKMTSSLGGGVDWELVKKVGHQMKGNAATFGFLPLAEFGRHLEAAAATQDTPALSALVEQLAQKVAQLLEVLERDSV